MHHADFIRRILFVLLEIIAVQFEPLFDKCNVKIECSKFLNIALNELMKVWVTPLEVVDEWKFARASFA